MRAKDRPVERLDLRFRADGPASKALLPGGILVWIVAGLTVGYGVWHLSQQHLKQQLLGQLAGAGTSGEAYLALESLLQLNDFGSLEIVSGLQNEDAQIARAAYRALDEQITQWQDSDSTSQLGELAEKLLALPDGTPNENLRLASSLAARVFAYCVSQNDTKLEPTITNCERIVQRGNSLLAGDKTGETVDELAELAEMIEPPPPLPPVTSTLRSVETPEVLVDQQFSDAGNGAIHTQGDVPSATLRLVPYRRTAPSLEEESGASFSLSDDPEPLEPAPLVARTVGDNPPIRMKINPSVELGGLSRQTDSQLVKLLNSIQPKVSQAAVEELRKRGWTDDQLELALQLATSSEDIRLDLIHRIAVRRDINPRPWLLWMAQAGEPKVRRTAISLLSSMLDNEVERALRDLLVRENDEEVTRAIRQALAANIQNSLRG